MVSVWDEKELKNQKDFLFRFWNDKKAHFQKSKETRNSKAVEKLIKYFLIKIKNESKWALYYRSLPSLNCNTSNENFNNLVKSKLSRYITLENVFNKITPLEHENQIKIRSSQKHKITYVISHRFLLTLANHNTFLFIETKSLANWGMQWLNYARKKIQGFWIRLNRRFREPF